MLASNTILVTGCHRSGSTFVGRMLGFGGRTAYLQEPFNLDTGLVGFDDWFQYICEGAYLSGVTVRSWLIYLQGLPEYRRKSISRNSDLLMTLGNCCFARVAMWIILRCGTCHFYMII